MESDKDRDEDGDKDFFETAFPMNAPDHPLDEQLPVQGVFDFESGAMDGYANWRRQQEQRLAAMRTEWGLPIARRVRLRLKTMDDELEGKLRLVQLPVAIDKRIPLRLSIEGIEFGPADIERCVVIE